MSDEIEVTVKLTQEMRRDLGRARFDCPGQILEAVRAAYVAQHPELEPGRFYLATCTADGERAVIVASSQPDHVHAVYAESGYGMNITMPVFCNIRPLVEQTPGDEVVKGTAWYPGDRKWRFSQVTGRSTFVESPATLIVHREKSIGGAP